MTYRLPILATTNQVREMPIFSTVREQTSLSVQVSGPRTARVSITDRCDLACVYCRPDRRDGYIQAEDRIELPAWDTVFQALKQAGIRRIRITGGEPLLHPNVVDFVQTVVSLGFDDVALTTNATHLVTLAKPLREAGLQRLTVSLDTLDAVKFFRITRGGRLQAVLDGIDAARALNFDEMKLNVVVVRGVNDDELEQLTTWSWDREITPRFLEIMLIGEGARMADSVVSGEQMRASLAHLLVDETATPDTDRGPAKYVRARHDSSKRVGFITGTSHTYCDGCDRLRVASDGTFRPCLATEDGVYAGDSARRGDIVETIERLAEAWSHKPDGKVFKGCTEPSAGKLSIRAIGG